VSLETAYRHLRNGTLPGAANPSERDLKTVRRLLERIDVTQVEFELLKEISLRVSELLARKESR
jgi:hypothetical protein